MPRTPYKRAKDKAWRWFSKYIRTRDCVRTTKFPDQCKCVTCGRYFPIQEIQAGHAIGGRNNSILFDEELVNGQCRGCNITGEYAKYSVWFIEKYGIDKWKEKIALSKEIKKYSISELEEIATDYRTRYNKLIKGWE